MINTVIKQKLKHVRHENTCLTILFGIHHNADPKMFRDCKQEIADLLRLGLLEQVEGKPSLVNPFYQEDAILLAPTVTKSRPGKSLPVKKIKAEKKLTVENWIGEYRALFPRGVKSTGLSYNVKGDPIQCIKRMKDFIADYGYDKETIMRATEMYIKEQKAKGWAFTKKAHKFIKDIDGSILSEYCELVVEGEDKRDVDPHTHVV